LKIQLQSQITQRNITTFYNTELFVNSLFILMLLSTLLVRLIIFFQYSCEIIDTDQPVMWLAAEDYAHGLFYEPRYYGQDYNTHMESLFAVPLLWLSVPVYYAVPIATHFIFIFPYIFTAVYLFFNQRKIHALLTLSIVLCMPAAYDLLNSLPRGFVTGGFFTSFFVINMLYPNRLNVIALNSIMAVLGFFVNPGSVLASLPFLFFIFLHNYKNLNYYVVSLLCAALLFPFHLLFDKFYTDHPDYVGLELDQSFSLHNFVKSISHLDSLFAQVSFFVEKNCLPLLASLLFFVVYLYLKNKKGFYAFIIFICLLLLSFFMSKTTQGSPWLFGALSRLYLAVPFVLCLFGVLISIRRRSVFLILFLIPVVFGVYKTLNYKKLLAWHFNPKNGWGAAVMPLKGTLEAIEYYKHVCEKNNVNFLMTSGRFWLGNELAYGGPAIYADYPETLLANAERRYTAREKNKDKVIERFVFISMHYDFDKMLTMKQDFKIQRLDDYGLYLITENKLKTSSFTNLVTNVEVYHRQSTVISPLDLHNAQ